MADPRPLLLGEDPGRRDDPRLPLLHLPRGRAGHRLRELLDLLACRGRRTDFRRLLDRPGDGEAGGSLVTESPADLLVRVRALVRGGGRLLSPPVASDGTWSVAVAVPEDRAAAVLLAAELEGWDRGASALAGEAA